MKILLFFPKLEPHKDFHHIPVTALSVAAELLAQGHEVTIWDDRVIRGPGKIFLPSMAENVDEIMMSAFTGFQLSQAHEHAKMFKRLFPEKKITLGGPHASALPEQTLADPYIDEVFVGEMDTGEHPLPYHLIDIEKYINPATKRFVYVSSYSCVGNCTFCQTTPRRQVQFLPLERVVTDIDNLMSIYPFEQAWFADATVFTKPVRALFIARLMQKHGLRWICDARADEICKVYPYVISEIMNSGLMRITIGLESGSPAVLEAMNKGKNHLEKFKRCAEIMSRYDVEMCSGVIFGCPGEGPEDIRQTIIFIKEIATINPRFRISSTFFRPLPQTRMAQMAEGFGYKPPGSLAEWAELGASNHYSYNEFSAAPWIREIDEYRAIYERFRHDNVELFV